MDDDIEWYDTYPYVNNVWDEGEEILDCGQDGICGNGDPGDSDGILVYLDLEELDGFLDTGDNCFGCFNAEIFYDCNDDMSICEYDEDWDPNTMGNGRYDNLSLIHI